MKKTQNLDYWNYDYINLVAKKKNADEVILAYNAFGWEEIKRDADNRYFDLLNLSFRRQRKIDKKDDLQYLQVAYERLLNKRTTYEYKKHEKSFVVISLACLICGVSFFGGAFVLWKARKALTKIIAGSMIGVGAILSFVFYKLVKKMRKKENERYNKRATKINSQIEETLKLVQELRGTGDEK